MCGFLFHNLGEQVSPEASLRALQKMRSRGPDEKAELVYSSTETMYFGHVRLSILDIDGGKQPFETENIILLFNGEIYNNDTLRNDLVKKGVIFTSDHSDTETIVRGFELEGDQFFQKLNGIFSILIYEKLSDRVFACRDHLGIKPLYYYSNGVSLIIASEIKAILEVLWFINVQLKLRDASLAEYFCFRSPVDGTMFKEIGKVLPKHCYIFDEKFCTRNKYDPYTLLPENKVNYLENEVGQQLQSDVEVGLLLSGGVDSSLTSILASKHASAQLRAFCLSTGGTKDESLYAKEVADKYKIDLHIIDLNPAKFKHAFEAWVKFNDDPLSDPSAVALFHLCDRIHKMGLKVLLSGEGADELFLGYNSYTKYYLSLVLNKLGLRSIAQRFFPTNFMDGQLTFWGTGMHTAPKLLSEIIGKKHLNKLKDKIHKKWLSSKDVKNFITNCEIEDRLANDLLMRGDRVSMAHSIELRVPFLGEIVVQSARRLSDVDCKGLFRMQRKLPLKKNLKNYMSRKFVDRRKIGFELPMINIVNDQFKSEIEVFISERLIPGIQYERIKKLIITYEGLKANIAVIWAWIVLEYWHREFVK